MSGCPLLGTDGNCTRLTSGTRSSAAEGLASCPPQTPQALLLFSFIHLLKSPCWPSKLCPRQGALKDSSVVWRSQKCEARGSGSDQQAASPQPDPPLSWLTDLQQLWPPPPGAGGWGLSGKVSSLEADGEGAVHTRRSKSSLLISPMEKYG